MVFSSEKWLPVSGIAKANLVDVTRIIAALRTERQEIEQAILSLEGIRSTRRRGRNGPGARCAVMLPELCIVGSSRDAVGATAPPGGREGMPPEMSGNGNRKPHGGLTVVSSARKGPGLVFLSKDLTRDGAA
jgi:hypothetical protein